MEVSELEDNNLDETGKGICESQHLNDPPPQPPGTGSQKKFAVKALFGTIILWTLHLVFAALLYHIEEPHEQRLLNEYEKKKTDLMTLFDKCAQRNTSEEPECMLFSQIWFNMTLQLAQEDPGKMQKMQIHVLSNLFLSKVIRNGL